MLSISCNLLSESVSCSVMSDSAIPLTVAHQTPLSSGFSRQEYWRRESVPPPGTLPIPGIEPRSPTLQADSLPSEPPGKPKLLNTLLKMKTQNSCMWTEWM